MREVYRILDANFNRAREALRVAEDCGRFALNDPAVTAMAKSLRSDLAEILQAMPVGEFLTSRDTPGDIGTEITSPTEQRREDLADVVTAACKRLTEAHKRAFEVDQTACDAIAAQCTQVDLGARNIDHVIDQTILPALSRQVLEKMGDEKMPAALTIAANDAGEFMYTFSIQS